MKRIETLMCAVDFSEPSDRAAREARRLAEQLAVKRFVLLHVFVPDEDDSEDAARAELAKAAELVGGEAELMMARGEAVPTILRCATEEGADLLVLGTEGKTGVRRTLFGSVAENVLRGADIPVVVVRGA